MLKPRSLLMLNTVKYQSSPVIGAIRGSNSTPSWSFTLISRQAQSASLISYRNWQQNVIRNVILYFIYAETVRVIIGQDTLSHYAQDRENDHGK